MANGSRPVDIAQALEDCRKPLLDTGGRSRLINFPLKGRKTKKWLCVKGEDPNQVFDRLVIRNHAFTFLPLPGNTPNTDGTQGFLIPPDDGLDFEVDQTDPYLQTDRHEDTLDGCLETIARDAKSCIDETGVNMLYLAVGMLEWYQSGDSPEPTYAPLILIPVELKKEFSEGIRRFAYPLRYNSQELQVNLSLAKRLEDDFGLRMPAMEDGQTPSEYFDVIRREVLVDYPKWNVQDHMVLAFFRFQKQLLYLDLDPRNWSNANGKVCNAQLQKVFEGVDRNNTSVVSSADESLDNNEVAQGVRVVMDADSSQHSALCDIALGRDLVIEGPPGSGKSQTIINAIASAIASGKTVLFVAEKLAALNVVYDRLQKLGLGDFCLNLHSDHVTLKRVYADLGQRLSAHFRNPGQIEAVRRDLLRKRQTLGAYLESTRKSAGPLDLPLCEVFWRAANLAGAGAPLLRNAGNPAITRDAFNESISALTALSKHISEVGILRECPWWGFDCPSLPQGDIPLLAEHLSLIQRSAESLDHASNALDDLVGLHIPWFETLHQLDPMELVRLDEVTATTECGLCRLIADQSRAEAARSLLSELTAFAVANAAATSVCTADWREFEHDSRRFASTYRDSVATTIDSEATVQDLAGWRSRLSQSLTILDQLESLMAVISDLGFGHAENLSRTLRVVDIYRLITDEQVLRSSLITEVLLLASTERDFLYARDQQQELRARHTILTESFAMPDIPRKEDLQALRRALRPYINCWHRWFWREYRTARSELKRFAVSAAKHDLTQWVANLDDLERWLLDVDTFGADARLVSGLGLAFEGWDTNWQVLAHLVTWGKALASNGVTGAKAVELVERCAQTEERPSLSALETCARQLSEELSELPVAMFGAIGGPDQIQFGALRSSLSRWLADVERLIESAAGFRQESTTPLAQINDAAKSVIQAAEMKLSIDGSNRYRHALPGFFDGIQTSILALDAALEMIERLGVLRLPTAVLQWIFDADSMQKAGALRTSLDQWMAQRDGWLKHMDELASFGSSPTNWIGVWEGRPDEQPPARIRTLLVSIELLPAWIEFCRSRRRCNEINLSPWIDAITDDRIRPDQLAASFDHTIHDAVARRESERDETLRRFSRQEHEQVRAEFVKLDCELIRLQCEQVRWQAGNRPPPSGVSTGHVGKHTQMGLIDHQVHLQRPNCSIRNLVRRAGGAAAALKPCWMMSPLSVAQFIEPGSMVFDLLIMDEASQIKPADALGSVARAEQVVVVGDPKQMPPSTWMERVVGNEVDTDDEEGGLLGEDSESILEWGMGAYRRKRRLKWHYRSQHESLIAFSNKHFYENELVIFPAPGTCRDKLGLRFHHVSEGRWANRRNVPEAQQVAQAILRHAREQPEATLGVATFNAPQMELIQEELDRLVSNDSEARHTLDRLVSHQESLFIKNVENLQGDERDVIFISYTYGPDAGGVVAQRFHPINTEKGWRRFNVLITRARQRIEVFSSMLPEQIAGGPNRPFGVRCMREYLIYARDGILADAGTPTGRPPDSDFEVAVSRAVQRLGYEVHAQVGVAGYFIDLGVLVPNGGGEYLLGIECDGATYHSAKSARDRDRLRQEVIERRGWSLHRIWSTDWFRNRTSEEIRLQKTIERLLGRRPSSGLA